MRRERGSVGVAVATTVVVMLLVVAPLNYLFFVKEYVVDKQGDIYRDSYGSEVARVDAARQAVVAFNATEVAGQRAALANQACALIADTQEVPSDLQQFAALNC